MPSPKSGQSLYRRHPRQRLDSPGRGLSALLHTASLISFAYSFRYLVITENPINESYGWHFQFLTIIGLAIATLSFLSGLLADVTLSRTLFNIKNILSLTSTPLEVLISILYWGLRFIDPALVLPEWAALLPSYIDYGFHLFPAVALTLDLLFFSPPWTISLLPAVGVSGVIAFGYWFWIEACFQKNGFYPYPIFGLLPGWGRVCLFAGSAGVMAAVTLGLGWLYGVVNGVDVVEGRTEVGPGKEKKVN